MSNNRTPHQVRIIAGLWRGRRVPVLDLPGLRPSGDRVRETVFNWLTQDIVGAKCLDLFAGTGALGLEALSRGAAQVVFVDASKQAIDGLRVATQTWPGIDKATFVHAKAQQWLTGPSEAFDGIFVDPPFDAKLHQQVLMALIAGGWLKSGGWVYLETTKNQALKALECCPELSLDRHKTYGQVDIALVRYHSELQPR